MRQKNFYSEINNINPKHSWIKLSLIKNVLHLRSIVLYKMVVIQIENIAFWIHSELLFSLFLSSSLILRPVWINQWVIIYAMCRFAVALRGYKALVSAISIPQSLKQNGYKRKCLIYWLLLSFYHVVCVLTIQSC